MKSGLWTYTPASEILADVKMELNLENISAFDAYLELKINQAVGEMDNKLTVVPWKVCLDLECGRAKVPDNFVEFLSGNISDANMFYVNQNYFKECGCDLPSTSSVCSYSGTVSVTNGWIDVNDSTATKMNLVYAGLNQDEQGRFKISSAFERACKAYAQFRYKKRFDLDYRFDYKEFKAQKSYWKAELFVIEAQEKRLEIAALGRAILPDLMGGGIFGSNIQRIKCNSLSPC